MCSHPVHIVPLIFSITFRCNLFNHSYTFVDLLPLFAILFDHNIDFDEKKHSWWKFATDLVVWLVDKLPQISDKNDRNMELATEPKAVQKKGFPYVRVLKTVWMC